MKAGGAFLTFGKQGDGPQFPAFFLFSVPGKNHCNSLLKGINLGIQKIFVKKEQAPLTIEKIKQAHAERRDEIRARLGEFEDIWKEGSDLRLWEEMVFCFFTGGCSAKMGLRSVEAVRPLLVNGTHDELMNALVGRHRYPR